VIVPADEAGVAACLREASAGGIAVTIAGAGTGITGARVPLGGWVLSLEKLDRLEVHSGYAIAGPGVLLGEVHAAAERSGQFYPPDPTETAAAIGGIGTLAGPILGAFILVPLSEFLREFGPLRIVFYGLILVVCVVALPEGIFHYLSRKYGEMERWVGLE